MRREVFLARLLGVHAVGLGAGWVPVLVAVGLSATVRDWLSSSPDVFRGGLVVVLVVFAAPLLWPFFLALGWYEGALAGELAHGRGGAAARAAVVLRAEALAFAAMSVILGALAASTIGDTARRNWFARPELRGAWVVPAVLGSVHWLLASAYRRAGAPASVAR